MAHKGTKTRFVAVVQTADAMLLEMLNISQTATTNRVFVPLCANY
jgi:hypothetical protein